MKRILRAMACGCLMLAHTVAAQPESPAVIAKQQLSECMAKRMSADKNLSYYEAKRVCKERLQPPKELASINPAERAPKGP